MNFTTGQRWCSITEASLGLGIVIEVDGHLVKIYFETIKEFRTYSTLTAPLRRVIFKEGENITHKDGTSATVSASKNKDELVHYTTTDGDSWSEVNLCGSIRFNQPIDRLKAGVANSRRSFIFRYKSRELDNRTKHSPVRGFLGGRVDIIPHQLFIADEVTNRLLPRVLLADEVGLGKTIEACLILHRLLLTGQISRTIILVPDALVYQWFVELYRKFNFWFTIIDKEYCLDAEERGIKNPFNETQLALCSIDFISNSKWGNMATRSDWDLLIVDEAHHLEWSETKIHPNYLLVEKICRQCQGVLLLTATPEQLGVESHFARLRLLDPERYHSFEAYQKEQSEYSATAKTATDLLEVNSEESMTQLHQLIDTHGPGRAVFRNTRHQISGFPKRLVSIIELESTLDGSAEFDQDMRKSKTDTSNYDFATDPRITWLANELRTSPDKILLICRTKEKVEAINRDLKNKLSVQSSLFHEELSLKQRDRNAAWFANTEDGAQLLICSEIGSEGRNFQFAHKLVLFDLPPTPEMLEQRIGRLDRIGQTEDIKIYVPVLKDSSQQRFAHWFNYSLNIFAEHFRLGNGCSEMVKTAQKLISTKVSSSKWEKFCQSSKIEVENMRSELEKGRDVLLELSSLNRKIAEKTCNTIDLYDQSNALEKYMLDFFERYGIAFEKISHQLYIIDTSQALTELPAISESRMTITFNRNYALQHEDSIFLTWDHPTVIGALETVFSDDRGQTAFGFIKNPTANEILMEVLFIAECSAPGALHCDRFLPPTTIRIVVNNEDLNVTDKFPSHYLSEKVRRANSGPILDNDEIRNRVIPQMMEAAKKFAKQEMQRIVEGAKVRTNQTFETELIRQAELSLINSNITDDDRKLLLSQQAELNAAIDDCQLTTDALVLIWHGSRLS